MGAPVGGPRLHRRRSSTGRWAARGPCLGLPAASFSSLTPAEPDRRPHEHVLDENADDTQYGPGDLQRVAPGRSLGCGSGLRGFDDLLVALVHGLNYGVVVSLVDRLANLLCRLIDCLVDAVQVEVVDDRDDCR